MRATIINCTLKPSPAESNTEALAKVVVKALEGQGVTTELVRVADYDVRPGVSSDEGVMLSETDVQAMPPPTGS